MQGSGMSRNPDEVVCFQVGVVLKARVYPRAKKEEEKLDMFFFVL
jgi:hypothetical protein